MNDPKIEKSCVCTFVGLKRSDSEGSHRVAEDSTCIVIHHSSQLPEIVAIYILLIIKSSALIGAKEVCQIIY